MAKISGDAVGDLVANVLFKTIKHEIKRRFVEMVTKDIEPILDEYTRQIVMQVDEMRDPASMYDLKLNIQFKLPNPPEIKNGADA